MKLSKIKLLYFIVLLINISVFSTPMCDICDDCDETPGVQCGPHADQKACYGFYPECSGIPVNENSYLLLLVGGILTLVTGTMIIRKQKSKYILNNN